MNIIKNILAVIAIVFFVWIALYNLAFIGSCYSSGGTPVRPLFSFTYQCFK